MPESILKQALEADVFDGLKTQKQETAYATENIPYLEPRHVDVGMKENVESVVSFDVADLLQRRLLHDKAFRQRVIAKSEEWKKGQKWCTQPSETGILSDIDDGTAARYHPHLMRPATVDEADDLRVGLIFNCDDIEVTRRLRFLLLTALSHA